MADAPLDQYALDPTQEEARLRAEQAATAPTFAPDVATYKDTATKEVAPLFSDVLSNIDTQTKQGIGKLNTTYDDLLKNIKETYNSRGTFFSGDATGAETKANTQRTEAIGDLESAGRASRSEVLLKQGNTIAARTAQLQEQAFTDFQRQQAAGADKAVYSSLAQYIPKHAAYIAEQAANENSPWLDLPIDGDSAAPAATTPAATTTAKPATQTKRQQWEAKGYKYISSIPSRDAAIKKYGANRVKLIDGMYFVTPK